MKLVTFAESERVALGRVDNGGRVRDLSDVVGARTLLEVIDAWEHLGPVIAAAAGLPAVDTPRLLASIPQPRRNLFAVGKNYRDHVWSSVAPARPIPELISVISAGITLRSGDIIATGTPAGVGFGFHPPRFLAPGDVVECAITGLGALRNTVSGA
ncbi:fumarylacetoacetate hydrolase family protein [Streptomyces sp. NPDC058086]|uniref:fumarylacetoacetate hydrolase family protein n=1 Tax=Streptomyces sp. NPDC058086 TaxID=3346334 RepID=UPI0036EC40AB